LAQFSRAAADRQRWAEKYSGTMDDVFDLQERVSREIVGGHISRTLLSLLESEGVVKQDPTTQYWRLARHVDADEAE
jgi:hypothetical protein